MLSDRATPATSSSAAKATVYVNTRVIFLAMMLTSLRPFPPIIESRWPVILRRCYTLRNSHYCPCSTLAADVGRSFRRGRDGRASSGIGYRADATPSTLGRRAAARWLTASRTHRKRQVEMSLLEPPVRSDCSDAHRLPVTGSPGAPHIDGGHSPGYGASITCVAIRMTRPSIEVCWHVFAEAMRLGRAGIVANLEAGGIRI